jgi:6-pyruvoyltetrahydropterin/6-carboxytetrahydropterin synthase
MVTAMATARLTRSVRFSAAHRYHRPDWSEAENRRRFGACANPHGHGHNYVLEVTLQGEIDADTGYCVDLGVLDELLRVHVVEPLDHQHLNHAIPDFAPGALVPTTENIARHLWPRIAAALPAGAELVRLRLHEDTDLFVDYYGGEVPRDGHVS